MANPPLVSVVVPNYNHVAYLEQRIESVLNQTFQDFEILIFDDASTDESLEVLNHYKKHSKVSHFIVNEVNSGSPFIQWRKGIELAQGKYIWIAETDDFAKPTFLEKTVEVLQHKPQVSLVYSESLIINDRNKVIGSWSTRKNAFFKTNRWHSNYTVKGIDEIIDYLLYKTTINNASAVLFRKSSINSKVFLNEVSAFKNVGDLYTYICCAINHEISYISEQLNNYRTHDNNLTKTNMKSGVLYSERLQCYIKTLDMLSDFVTNNDQKNRVLKGVKHILKKNSFAAINNDFDEELILFVKKCTDLKIMRRLEGMSYIRLFKWYKWNTLKSRKISKRLVKALLNN